MVLGALGCVVVGFVIPANGYTDNLPPWLFCFNDSEADLLSLERSLGPANDAIVPVGAPVSFSGSSGAPVTFAVASSPALLPIPDIDSGAGSAQAGPESSMSHGYTFSSSKATAAPGTIYWDASFSNAGLTGCEGLTPATYTTAVRTLTVLAPPPTETAAAVKQKQEEAAAKQQAEEAAAKKKLEEATAGSVSLAGDNIKVQSSGEAQVKLACTGTVTCGGELTLSAKIASKASGKGKRQPARTVRIGTASFSIVGDATKTVKVNLDAVGRGLLIADHGRLNASLTVMKSEPGVGHPIQTQTEKVQLVQQKAHGKAKK